MMQGDNISRIALMEALRAEWEQVMEAGKPGWNEARYIRTGLRRAIRLVREAPSVGPPEWDGRPEPRRLLADEINCEGCRKLHRDGCSAICDHGEGYAPG